jgi:hypothetical protein
MESQNNSCSETITSGETSFIKEVARYYMDFLETDFHRRKNPKRSVQYRNKNNLLVGINLNKYSSFEKTINKLIEQGFKNNKVNIKKGCYKANIPNVLLKIVNAQLEQLSMSDIHALVEDISDQLINAARIYKQEPDQAISTTTDFTIKTIKTRMVLPFVTTIEKSLSNLKFGDENTIFTMEENLTEVLFRLLEEELVSLVAQIIAGENVDVFARLKRNFDFDNIKISIRIFFEGFIASDLFTELFELLKNKKLTEKQMFYLYLGEMTYNKNKYPVFYLPFNLTRMGEILTIEFDARIYINKKALEFVAEEINKSKDQGGKLYLDSDRIIYINHEKTALLEKLNTIFSEITHFFNLDNNLSITTTKRQVAKSLQVNLSNNFYISLFDNADEALVNDYEEILCILESTDNPLAAMFKKIIKAFIYQKEPKVFNRTVEEEWDKKETTEKLSFISPIPLNSEQLQILSALNKEGCKYVTVEGPPGTGKSHTITAIAFDAILKNKSVLVLSDKKEALDVVEDKITQTMNHVRLDKKFQNPILRLGKSGSNYQQILSQSSISNIKNHYRAVKKQNENLENEIEKYKNTIKDDLGSEIISYDNIEMNEIIELIELERFYETQTIPFDLEEAIQIQNISQRLFNLRNILIILNRLVKTDGEYLTFLKRFVANGNKLTNVNSLKDVLTYLKMLDELQKEVKEKFPTKYNLITKLQPVSEKQFKELNNLYEKYLSLKKPIFGFLFNRKKMATLNRKLLEIAPASNFDNPHKNLDDIYEIIKIGNYILSKKDIISRPLDFLKTIMMLLSNADFTETCLNLISKIEIIDIFFTEIKLLPLSIEKAKISVNDINSIIENKIINMNEHDYDRLVHFIALKQKVIKAFGTIPMINFLSQRRQLENLVATQMTFALDKRVINFYENNKNTAVSLRKNIQSQHRFPKDDFYKLKEAFPCILSGIRDYAEYIPLEPEIFDLIIIDEASQVSIAQAFPALLRAKKILILGDRKQFSNIKAAHARSETNIEYLRRLQDTFKQLISNDISKITKLEKFNIKTSILDFFEFISNFNIQLTKHFRGYKEIISYSNKNFYDYSLQVMKIRGKPINQTIKFTEVEHDEKHELIQNTNKLEVDFVIKELLALKESGHKCSVGIITPHTNQQKLIVDQIHLLSEKDYFIDELNLKVMTFDTCQGEERDLIYYSMVATKDNDHLWGIFPKTLTIETNNETGNIRRQRLNVGLSRAKECIHFVLSKPIEDYSGAIGDALRHYAQALEDGNKEHSITEVDQNSAMEKEVFNWFHQTQFYLNHKDKINFSPQFELGKYLKQLDKTYSHPNYRVDFLMFYQDGKIEHKIIIEYDGFKEHFVSRDEINHMNYDRYYSEKDVYRQKVLESYGYKFLRINKFNVGLHPVKSLNARIIALIEENTAFQIPSFMSEYHHRVEGLQNGEMKECPKCREIRTIESFKDSSLITGYGRICLKCKGKSASSRTEQPSAKIDECDKGNKLSCPKCNNMMVLRKGKYGKFYGCSKYPYCRGTRPYF